jgi:hypothetical protein
MRHTRARPASPRLSAPVGVEGFVEVAASRDGQPKRDEPDHGIANRAIRPGKRAGGYVEPAGGSRRVRGQITVLPRERSNFAGGANAAKAPRR